MEDEKIIDLFNKREEGAIEALKVQYGDRAMAIAEKILGDRRDAEEALNDALHVLWKKIPPEKPRYLWAYLSRVLRNLCCDQLDRNQAARRQRSAEVCFEELEGCIHSEQDLQRIVESKQIAEVINRFLDGLGHTERTIFVRRYYYFDSCQEIGRKLGMTRGAVNTRLHRLRACLRKQLKKEGYLYE